MWSSLTQYNGSPAGCQHTCEENRLAWKVWMEPYKISWSTQYHYCWKLGFYNLPTRDFVSPFTPFKPDGSLHMCVDSRPGNRCTESMKFTLLNMAEMIQSWRGTKYVCTMDAAQGYFQAPLNPCSYKYSDLLTKDGNRIMISFCDQFKPTRSIYD